MSKANQQPDWDNPWNRLLHALAGSEAASVGVARPPKIPRYPEGRAVQDSSLGRRRTWQATFPWEGRRWLEALSALDLPKAGPVQVVGYLSESPEVRRMLALEAQEHLRGRGLKAQVSLRSSYKTGLFWILEEVLPRLRRAGADGLGLAYPVAQEPPAWRFLQETFPLVDRLETEGIALESQPLADATMGYQAIALKGNTPLWQLDCPLPLYRRSIVGGSSVWASSGGLRVECGGRVFEQRLFTDGELFWDWYCGVILPEVLELSGGKAQGPFFRNLTVAAWLSEPEVELGVGQECASMPEALAEEVYFTTLEAFKHQQQLPPQGRGQAVGRIVPVVQVTPGQDGRARVVLIENGQEAPEPPTLLYARRTELQLAALIPPWEAGSLDVTHPTHPEPLPARPLRPQEVWQAAYHQSRDLGLRLEVPAYSYDGRPILALSRGNPPGKPALLITAGQHANEPSGPKAALKLIEILAGDNRLNWVVFPLENPDGTKLHQALMQLAPHHMHHPARYTALGDDLQARLDQPQPRWEAAGRHWALQEFRPKVHLNLHGYPSHEWVRPYTGYAPRGFEAWSLPMGVLMVLHYTPAQKTTALELGEAIATALGQKAPLCRLTTDALRRREAHSHHQPYTIIGGFPFLLWEKEAEGNPPIEVITEMPDETVYGPQFELLVEAQVLVGQTVIEWLQNRGEI